MSDVGELLTVREAAKRLGLRTGTIRRKILERRIDYVKIGRAVRIPSKVIDQIIEEGWRAARESYASEQSHKTGDPK
ncbi:helix-turn-helix domain [Caudoviricetes sp.]|nr:helix-turn-helix domain [Caudoviricetes sp.]